MSEIPKLNQEIREACQLYVDNLINRSIRWESWRIWLSVWPAF